METTKTVTSSVTEMDDDLMDFTIGSRENYLAYIQNGINQTTKNQNKDVHANEFKSAYQKYYLKKFHKDDEVNEFLKNSNYFIRD